MSNALPPTQLITLESLHREIMELRQRVEDLEDLNDLEEAIAENNNRPLISWSEAKKELLD